MDQHPLHVLLVEDEDKPDTLALYLVGRDDMYRLSTCSTLLQALKFLTVTKPDVLLLDVKLPDAQGLPALDRIRALDPGMAIIMQASQPDEQLALAVLNRGAQDFLVRGQANRCLLDRTLRHAMHRQHVQSENQRLVLELEQIARIDPLTGVLNRHFFTKSFQREWSRVSRSKAPLSCVILDIDLFKRVNDQYGHPLGDEVLKAVSGVLSTHCRTHDCIARYGGEEFCGFFPDTDEAGALQWANRAREAIAQVEVPAGREVVRVTASFGVAERLEDTASADALLDMADQCLLAAKQMGRNRSVRFRDIDGRMAGSLDKSQQLQQLEGLTAQDIMSPVLASVKPDTPLHDVLDYLLQLRVDALPVVGETGELAGIVSEEDLTPFVLISEGWSEPASHAMRKNVVCFDVDAELATIYQFFTRVSMRRIIVTDKDRPVGVLSRASLIRWFQNNYLSHVVHQELAGDHLADVADDQIVPATIDKLKTELIRLEKYLAEHGQDPFALVAGTSRMQDLLDQLMTKSHGPFQGIPVL